MPGVSSYPANLDPIPEPDWDGALGQPARTAEAFLGDMAASIKALQEGVGTVSDPGPLLDAVAAGGGGGGGVNTLAADTTGLVDASADVQAWADAMAAGNSNGYAPPGDYLLASPINLSGLNSARFGITGAGVGITRFIVPASNTTGAFIFDGTGAPRDAQVQFRDFTVMTQGVGEGTALKFDMTEGGAQHQRSVRIERVLVCGEDIETDCFDVGIDVSGAHRPYLEDVIVTGPWGPGASGVTTDASPQYVATCALDISGCYEPYVNACHLWAAYTLLRSIGTNEEAGRISNCQLVSGRVGIEWTRTGREPHFQVEGCHINARDTAIQVDGAKIIFIRGCHLYNTDDTNEFSGTARDIYLKNSEMVLITDNIFHFDGAPDRVHIHVDSTTYGQKITIANNIFNAIATNAVLIGTAADNVTLLGNQYTGTYTKRVLDNSGKAVIFDSVAGLWRMSSHNVGSGTGPVQQMMRDSVSPAASDLLGRLSMLGRDSAANETEYAAIQGILLDPTDASEDGAVAVWGQVSGALVRLAQVQDVSSFDSTSLFLYVKRATVTGFERVTLGAVDSAGTGYRVLRVPN